MLPDTRTKIPNSVTLLQSQCIIDSKSDKGDKQNYKIIILCHCKSPKQTISKQT